MGVAFRREGQTQFNSAGLQFNRTRVNVDRPRSDFHRFACFVFGVVASDGVTLDLQRPVLWERYDIFHN